MATDIPTPAAMGAELLIDLATQGISAILKAFHKNGAAAGVDAANGVAMGLLQASAQISGAAVDWTDPAAVAAYVSTLPTFTPIPDPTAAAPIAPASDATKKT